MRKLLLILLFVGVVLSGYTQTTEKQEKTKEEQSDTTKIKFKNKTVKIIKDDEGETILKMEDRDNRTWSDFEDEDWDEEYDDWERDYHWGSWEIHRRNSFCGHWAGLDLGLNNYVDENFSMSRKPEDEFMDLNTGYSWNINLNFLQFSQNIAGNRFGIVTGMGFEWNIYRFDNNVTITKGAGGEIIPDSTFINNGINLDKSKLTTTYLTVPLLFELQLLKNNQFFINAGVIGGMKIGSNTKVKYQNNGNEEKEKTKDDFNLNSFRYGVTARMGIRGIYLYASYYFTPLFEANKGPELYPLSAGISWSF